MACNLSFSFYSHQMPPPRSSPDQPFATVQTALDNGCQVDALCLDCDRVSRLDLSRLTSLGRAGTALIRLPMACQSAPQLLPRQTVKQPHQHQETVQPPLSIGFGRKPVNEAMPPIREVFDDLEAGSDWGDVVIVHIFNVPRLGDRRQVRILLTMSETGHCSFLLGGRGAL